MKKILSLLFAFLFLSGHYWLQRALLKEGQEETQRLEVIQKKTVHMLTLIREHLQINPRWIIRSQRGM